MPLPHVLYPPSGPGGMKAWLFWHWQHHQAVVDAIKAKYGIILPTYVIDPMPDNDLSGWALRHQGYHSDVNSILGVDGIDLQSTDLGKEDERDKWLWSNLQEHRAWGSELGV